MRSIRRSVSCWPAQRELLARGTPSREAAANAVAACAEGYAFPTDLDLDPPRDGLAPPAPAALMQRALDEAWEAPRPAAALQEQSRRHRA